MTRAILYFELKTWLKSPVYYLFAAGFFLFALVSTLGSGGYFDASGAADPALQHLNSPYSLSAISFFLGKLLLLCVAVIGSFTLCRDYTRDAHALLYSFPLTKESYLTGKLGSAVLCVMLLALLSFFGIWMGDLILGDSNPATGRRDWLGYGVAIGVYLIPTLSVTVIIVFVMSGITRHLYSGFVAVICLLLWQTIAESTLFNHDTWLALLDPFGQYAFQLATREWTVSTQNSGNLPVNNLVLWNRLLWLSLASILYSLFYRKFSFQYNSPWQFRTDTRDSHSGTTHSKFAMESATMPAIHLDFSLKARLVCLARLTLRDFRSVAGSRLFLLICLFGSAAIFFIQLRVSTTGDFTLLPLTRLALGAPLSLYVVIIIFSTFLFSGQIIHAARQAQMDQLLDTTPVQNWQLILSTIGAIGGLQVVMLCLFILISVSIQMLNGYSDFKLSLYVFHLFCLVFPLLLIWAITSNFVHSLIPNMYASIFTLGVLWMGAQSLDALGIQTTVLKFATLPVLTYSDFNGYGHQLGGTFLLIAYWSFAAAIFGVLLHLSWLRGCLESVSERLRFARSRTTRYHIAMIFSFTSGFLWLGVMVHQAETEALTATGGEVSMNELKKLYTDEWAMYESLAQPKITDLNLRIDLYPDDRRFDAAGIYTLVNKSTQPIDTLLIRTGFDEKTSLTWHEPATLIKLDPRMKSFLYRLHTPLKPGDSLQFSFSIENSPNTLFTRNSNVLKNGTYLRQDILPRLSYQFTERELPLSDPKARRFNYFHQDADYVTITTRISTSADHIAIAPGDLISDSLSSGRRTFTYRTPVPVKLNASFHSASYELLERSHSGVQVELYYLEGHHHNIDMMMNGVRSALDVGTALLGEYPYRQLRIVEIPHTEEPFAASLAGNTIIATERLFMINTSGTTLAATLPFYVMVHELMHEWFGNQMMPADAEGAKMLTESITEYLSFIVLRDTFGELRANEFLQVQHNRYVRGRRNDESGERPLKTVLSHQEYISYGKGAIAFAELSQAIGDETFNLILAGFLSDNRYQTDAYPTTDDFISYLKARTPDKHHPLIDDWLTTTKPMKRTYLNSQPKNLSSIYNLFH